MTPDSTSLDLLHDIAVPPPTPWWPPAPAWYWLLAFAMVILIVFTLQAILHWQRNQYRREALAELRRLRIESAALEQRATAIVALATLLKRTALSAWPRSQVAALTGPVWVAFLEQTGGLKPSIGSMLDRAVYDPRVATSITDTEFADITTAVRHWLFHHNASVAVPNVHPDNQTARETC